MQWYVQTACTEPDVPDPTARWSRESTITTVIIDLITGASTALLAYTAPVALVLMGRQSSADPIKAIPDQTGGLQPTSAQQDPKDAAPLTTPRRAKVDSLVHGFGLRTADSLHASLQNKKTLDSSCTNDHG